MRCPICQKSSVHRRWEISPTGRGWWNGEYECPRCTIYPQVLRISGTRVNGAKQILHWHPSCEKCGPDSVVRLEEEGKFLCTVCGARYEVQDLKLVKTWHRGKFNSRHAIIAEQAEPSGKVVSSWNGILAAQSIEGGSNAQ